MPELETITPSALHAIANAPVRLIDVRTPREFARSHARGAENVPAADLVAATLTASPDPVYLICRGGTRAVEVCERLVQSAPGARAVVVEGGTLAWEAAGLPVVRPWDWRRYRGWVNRIGGILTVVSILLSIFIHQGLLGIVGFIGAALVINQMVVNRSLRREAE